MIDRVEFDREIRIIENQLKTVASPDVTSTKLSIADFERFGDVGCRDTRGEGSASWPNGEYLLRPFQDQADPGDGSQTWVSLRLPGDTDNEAAGLFDQRPSANYWRPRGASGPQQLGDHVTRLCRTRVLLWVAEAA